jgi:hypothetical protein
MEETAMRNWLRTQQRTQMALIMRSGQLIKTTIPRRSSQRTNHLSRDQAS